MKKQSLLIIGANLAIVALLAVTATFLINKGSDESAQTDVRSSAAVSTPKPTATKVDEVTQSLENSEKDTQSIVEGSSDVEDIQFPEFNVTEFE